MTRKVLLITLLFVAAAAFGVWRWLAQASPDSLAALNSTEIPLKLKVVGPGDKPLENEESLLASQESGDSAENSNQKELKVVRYPVAVSAYVRDGKGFLSWIERNQELQSFLKSPLVEGIFRDALKTAKVRAEDVKLQGAKGAIVTQLARDVVGADLVIHYDIARGARGFAVHFDRTKSNLVRSILPLVTASLAKRSYRVPGLPNRIHEVLIGEQTFLLSQQGPLVFVSNGLTTLLNVLDQAASDLEFPITKPEAKIPADSSIGVIIRSEAFVNTLLPILTGRTQWHVSANVRIGEKGIERQEIRTDPATIYDRLSPGLSQGVLAAIPRDTFIALAGSFDIPTEFNPQAWYESASLSGQAKFAAPSSKAGFGIVWDLNYGIGEDLSQVGLIVGKGKEFPIEQYVNSGMGTARCAGDSISLASNSSKLLTRMREACDRQSPSMLGSFDSTGDAPLPQLVVALNPSPGFEQMLHTGVNLARDESAYVSRDQPQWKEAYQAAVRNKTAQALDTLALLPGLLFRGAANQDGAILSGMLTWPEAAHGQGTNGQSQTREES